MGSLIPMDFFLGAGSPLGSPAPTDLIGLGSLIPKDFNAIGSLIP